VEEQWLERWQEGRIGWHDPDGNPGLQTHWRAAGRSVLVPMCGKSVDLRWIAEQGNQVIGVELSDLAIKAFFAEQGLDYTVQDGDLRAYRANDAEITIFCGNYFDLHGVRCNAHYDRGALIAMPAEMRPAYAAHTNSLLTPDAEQLVIAIEYEDSVAVGPPFSVSEEEVLSYWPGLVCIEQRDDIENAPPKFVKAGLTELIEKVWRSA
jgi:thiopurine S-methyltransferase